MNLFFSGSFDVSAVTGVTFSRIIGFKVKEYYLYDEPETGSYIKQDMNQTLSLDCGILISKSFKNGLILNLNPFINWHYLPPENLDRPSSYTDLPEDNIVPGVRLGLAYNFHEVIN